MYYYKLKEGNEGRLFIGVKTHENGVIESAEPLTSSYVEEIEVKVPAEPTTETINEEQE